MEMRVFYWLVGWLAVCVSGWLAGVAIQVRSQAAWELTQTAQGHQIGEQIFASRPTNRPQKALTLI